MIKQIQHTEKGKMSLRMTSFEEILNYFKLRNCWLNSKLCAKRKLLQLFLALLQSFLALM